MTENNAHITYLYNLVYIYYSFYKSCFLHVIVISISVHGIDAMLNKIAFSYFRSAFFHRHLSLHKYRHYHSCLSVKQALESDPSRSIPVLIQVGRVKPMFDCFLFVYH